MKKLATNRKLGRTTDIRMAMLKNLTTDLLVHGKIETTETRAKEVRKCFDKMVTYGKSGSLVSRRLALAFLHHDNECVKKVFNAIKSPLYSFTIIFIISYYFQICIA